MLFKADNLHLQDSNAVIKDRRDRRRAGEQGLHMKHIYISEPRNVSLQSEVRKGFNNPRHGNFPLMGGGGTPPFR